MKMWLKMLLFLFAFKAMLVFFSTAGIFGAGLTGAEFEHLNSDAEFGNSTFISDTEIISIEMLEALKVDSFDLLQIGGAIFAFFEIAFTTLFIVGFLCAKIGAPAAFCVIVETICWLPMLIGLFQFVTGREVEN